MLIEGIGTVTFVNGLLKIQTVAVNAAGEVKETGQIEIPGSRVAEVINGMSSAANGIQEKLSENNLTAETKEKGKSKKGKKK
tara:strand:+ start:1158 stop:1403 length:246 start_codon:yes stop_codon:yes gene_type:complete